MGRELNRHFPTEEIQMVNWYMKRFNITNYQGNTNKNLTSHFL